MTTPKLQTLWCQVKQATDSHIEHVVATVLYRIVHIVATDYSIIQYTGQFIQQQQATVHIIQDSLHRNISLLQQKSILHQQYSILQHQSTAITVYTVSASVYCSKSLLHRQYGLLQHQSTAITVYISISLQQQKSTASTVYHSLQKQQYTALTVYCINSLLH